ncbi:unnamed protein product [Closterium sp. Yama58-4]|nr:unnamed protein product [Closterium sp. Yama58-4]
MQPSEHDWWRDCFTRGISGLFLRVVFIIALLLFASCRVANSSNFKESLNKEPKESAYIASSKSSPSHRTSEEAVPFVDSKDTRGITADPATSDGPVGTIVPSQSTLLPRPSSSSNVLITLLDGSIRAVDSRTGEVKWTFASGQPLVSAAGPAQGAGAEGGLAEGRLAEGVGERGAEESAHGGKARHGTAERWGGGDEMDWDYEEDEDEEEGEGEWGWGGVRIGKGNGARGGGGGERDGSGKIGGKGEMGKGRGRGAGKEMVIPGVNGRLYSYREGLGLQELPITAKELVSASPSVTRDGATVIVGSQKSTAFLLDPVTGAVLRSFDPLAPPGGGGLSFSATSNDGNEQMDGPLADCLKMAEEEGGEGVGIDGGVGFLEGSRSSEREGAEGVPQQQQQQQQQKKKRECDRLLASSLLVLRTDYVVRAVELRSGKQRWNVSFGELSPVNGALLGLAGGVGGGVGGGAPIGGVLGGALGAGREGGGGRSGMDLTGRGVFDGHGSGVPNAAAASLAVAKRQLLPSSVSGEDSEPDIDLGIGAGGQGQGERDEIGGLGLAGFNRGLTAAATTSMDPSEEGNSDIYSIQLTNTQTGQQAWQTTFSSAPLAAFTPSGRLVQEFVSRDSSKDTGPGQVLYVGRVAGSPFALVTPSSTDAPNAALPLLPASPHSPSDGLPTGMAAGLSGGGGVGGGAVAGRTGKFTVTDPPRIAGTRGASVAAGEAGDGNGGGGRGRGRSRGRLGTGAASGSGGSGSGDDSLYPIVVRAPGAAAALYDAMGCADSPAVHGGIDLAGADLWGRGIGAGDTIGVASNADMELGAGRGEKNRRLGPPKDMEPAVGPQAPPTPPNLLSSFGILAAAAATLAGIVAGASQDDPANGIVPSGQDAAGDPGREDAGQGESGGGRLSRLLGSVGKLGSGSRQNSAGKLISRRGSRDNEGPGEGPGGGGIDSHTAGKEEREEDGEEREEGRWVGRLFVSRRVIGHGSHGTLVLEGRLEGRQVAVKRMLSQFYERARQEIAALIATDEHPNVVRCFAMEEDESFVYVALERCAFNLADLVRMRGKLSDMGISKRLGDGASSFDTMTAGSGSSGWQAPEQLEDGSRLTKSVDMFSFGCLVFFCVSGGSHPFGEWFERDANVVAGRADLFPIDHVPEALDLVAALLDRDPEKRPPAHEVQRHPFFWSAEQRLAFLRDASDRVEGEDREAHSPLLNALEAVAPRAIARKGGISKAPGEKGGGWNERVDGALLGNLGKYRRYNFHSVRDLLRVIRNKCNHYRELPSELQELLGPLPDGFESLMVRTSASHLKSNHFPVFFMPRVSFWSALIPLLLQDPPPKSYNVQIHGTNWILRIGFSLAGAAEFAANSAFRKPSLAPDLKPPRFQKLVRLDIAMAAALASPLASRIVAISRARRLSNGATAFNGVQQAILGNSYSLERVTRASPSLPVSRRASRSRVVMASAATASGEELADFVARDNRRMLHVVYRVGDLDAAIKFYTECLGMKLLRQRDIPEEKYSNAFLGYGPETSTFVVELTYNYGVDSYDIGAGFGHFGIAVEDVYKTVEVVKSQGGKVTREAGPVKGGQSVIAFVEDPSGYKWEIIQRPPTPEPLCQVMLRVGDLDRAIKFYEKAYGMKLLRTRDNPQYKYTIAMVGYGPEAESAVVELTYNYGVESYEKGNAYAQIAIGTDDVYKTAEAIRAAGGTITREPGPIPGINTKIVACLDPDGYKTVFVDNQDFLRPWAYRLTCVPCYTAAIPPLRLQSVRDLLLVSGLLGRASLANPRPHGLPVHMRAVLRLLHPLLPLICRAFATYCLVGGCWGAPLSLILGPWAYWLTCVPCYASSMRRQLRHKKGLHERPMDDFAAHCCCHPCALCQEYRESHEFDLELVAGPTHPTVDRQPPETARHLEHLQEAQQMER